MSGTLLLAAAAALAAGFAAGLAYFAATRRTALLIAAGGGWTLPVALTLARLAGIALLLALAARFGAVPLLTGFAGFLGARWIALRGGGSAG